MALPTITLMQADEVGRPFHRDGWIYEEKYGGWRMVAYKDDTAVKLVSRAGKDHSRRFPEVVAAIRFTSCHTSAESTPNHRLRTAESNERTPVREVTRVECG